MNSRLDHVEETHENNWIISTREENWTMCSPNSSVWANWAYHRIGRGRVTKPRSKLFRNIETTRYKAVLDSVRLKLSDRIGTVDSLSSLRAQQLSCSTFDFPTASLVLSASQTGAQDDQSYVVLPVSRTAIHECLYWSNLRGSNYNDASWRILVRFAMIMYHRINENPSRNIKSKTQTIDNVK